jgi:hypothetical protein
VNFVLMKKVLMDVLCNVLGFVLIVKNSHDAEGESPC